MRIMNIFRSIVPDGMVRQIRYWRLKKRYGLLINGNSTSVEVPDSSFGVNCRLAGPVYIGNCRVGDFSYVEPFCRISSTDIGKFCSIAANCIIGPPDHRLDFVSTHPAFFLRSESLKYTFIKESRNSWDNIRTSVGNDVWVGASSVIRKGVSIGDGAIIGAGAVVTKDIPAYAVACGVPAKIVKYRFDSDTIERLLELKWWNRDHRWLQRHGEDFSDVEKILNKSMAEHVIKGG